MKRRLRMRLLADPGVCPCCGQNLDVYMDHALTCMCGGDRTLRHNSIRNEVFAEAREAGLRCEKEKSGLLPPRPHEETLRGESGSSGRRPADIWFADWGNGQAAAVDFAVTSGLRSDTLVTSATDATAVLAMYDDRKRSYLDTEAACNIAGLAFLPFIIEADGGGLGTTARRVCSFIAKASAAKTSGEAVEQATSLLRRITVSLHRENARATLRRLPAPPPHHATTHPAVWTEDQCWQ